ncbi:hypothetical protein Pedsa_2711 [Pseudopedobacter saltans DSM 12145]|uniref:PpiC domain-containing protein n=1 Tax=Pseudopedobacter saltans (strain ATCC 51119 / DSM 12145 / JCM 21818 / CCUG 39354 / LMG 10337 / NBRC 100064 / NCIMB 13643) TaxID=762903 RepID=F0S6Z0_PSESL|nr:hypothetical protein [Pseudopedobacter saltans]ADY53253.1 hypothetical protein Pedsa_2711 [Pseudopedobacter saltans DSM 12145]
MLKKLFILHLLVFNFLNIQAQVADKVILSIGKVDITQYELEKNLNIFKVDFIRKNNSNPTSDHVKEWLQSFVNHTYLLADAYEKGFDTLKEVSAKVEGMEHLVLSQPGGLLDEKMAKEELTAGEAEDALRAASKNIIVEYLDFENYQQVVKLIGERVVRNRSEFDNAVTKNSEVKVAEFKVDTLKWPFALFDNKIEIASALKSNEIIFFESSNTRYYLVHVKDIAIRSESDMNSIKSEIINFLVREEQVKARAKYQKEIEQKSQAFINNEALSRLIKYMANYWGMHEFDKKTFSDYLQLNLISYNFDKQTKTISVNQFIDYYNYLPLKRAIEQEADIHYYLQAMVYDVYAYQKAKEYGLTRERRFLLDKENYKKNIIYSLYERQMREGINISDKELKEKYDLGKAGFIQATEVNVSIYYFDNLSNAITGMINLKKDGREINKLLGIKNVERKQLNNQSTLFPDTVKNMIFSINNGSVLRPFFHNGQYVVVVKESESGQRVKNMNEMKEVLIKEIRNEKLKYRMTAYLTDLKALYPVKNEINYKVY